MGKLAGLSNKKMKKMFEKYDATRPGFPGGGGEYAVPADAVSDRMATADEMYALPRLADVKPVAGDAAPEYAAGAYEEVARTNGVRTDAQNYVDPNQVVDGSTSA